MTSPSDYSSKHSCFKRDSNPPLFVWVIQDSSRLPHWMTESCKMELGKSLTVGTRRESCNLFCAVPMRDSAARYTNHPTAGLQYLAWNSWSVVQLHGKSRDLYTLPQDTEMLPHSTLPEISEVKVQLNGKYEEKMLTYSLYDGLERIFKHQLTNIKNSTRANILLGFQFLFSDFMILKTNIK